MYLMPQNEVSPAGTSFFYKYIIESAVCESGSLRKNNRVKQAVDNMVCKKLIFLL